MSPRLLPYTWFRHAVPALLCGAAAVTAWWGALVGLDGLRQAARHGGTPPISPEVEGLLMLTLVAATSAAAQIVLEGRWRRLPGGLRAFEALAAFTIAAATTALGVAIALRIAAAAGMEAGTLALRWRVAPWCLAGGGVAAGTLTVRLGRDVLEWAQVRWDLRALPAPPPQADPPLRRALTHGFAGLGAGLLAALAWYQLGQGLGSLHLASASAAWLLGAVPVALSWPVPEDLFQGWIRVLRGARPGWRVPLDADSVMLSERFVGHFPVGMDLHLPAEEGVAELHLSVLARGEGVWAARGLSRRPTRVSRLLARIDLSTDPRLPAPLETPLMAEDRLHLGDDVVLELVVVPREQAS